MDGVNALIATGGAYRPPSFDLQTAQGNALQNQLMQQQLQLQPQRMQLAEQEMRLRELALDIRAKASQSTGKISLDYPTFTIEGDSEAVAEVADAVARYPDQASDPQFLPWVASKQVSVKKREEKSAEDKSQTEEQLTRTALYDPDPGKRAQAKSILDAMQQRKIATAQSMPAPTVYVGTTGTGEPILTGGTKGKPELKTPPVPGGGRIEPKPTAMPSEMVVAEQQIATLQNTLDRVNSNYDASYVGPVAGRLGAVKEQWTGIPDKQAMFYADLAQVNNSLVYLMSGKQINEEEYKRLLKQLPVATLPEGVFKSRMKVFKSTLESIIEERHKNMKSRGVQPKETKNKIGRFTIEVE